MGSRLFNHSAVLTLSSSVVGEYFTTESNAVVIKSMRVVFSIEKRLDAQPNECSVSVYNLSKQARAAFQAKPLHVTLDVGYDGDLSRVFSGDLRYGSTDRMSPETVTKLILADGDRAINYARVKRTYPANVTRRTVLTEAATAMGLRVPTNLADAKELLDQFSAGLTLNGSAANALTKVLAPKGLGWSVQDGELQILRTSDTRADGPIEISRKTGMVESPQLSAPAKSGSKPRLTVKCLLNSQIKPGGRIHVISSQLDSIFKVQRVLHDGDTHAANSWTSTVEATPV